jgi:hypothetical protein
MFNIHLSIDTILTGKTTDHPGNLQTQQFFLGHHRNSGQKSTFIGILDIPSKPVFLNRRTAAPYRALASIIPGRERFSWN